MGPLALILTSLLMTPQMGALKQAGRSAANAVVKAEVPAAEDIKTGDLIFHTSTSSQAAAIAAATLSPLTHVGMIRVYGGKAFVIEASATVRVVPLATFIARGRMQRFLILRDPTLSDDDRAKIWRGARALKGKPYDLFFTYDKERVYCSELVWRAYAAAGKEPAKDEVVSDLFVDNPAVDALMKARWRRHPTCKRANAKSLTACMTLAKKERIITPAKIADDARYEVVASNYPPPWQ